MILQTLSAIAPGTSLGWLRWIFAGPVVFSLAYWIASAMLLRRRFQGAGAQPAPATELPPVTFFRPVKRGVPGLREKVLRLVCNARPGDQVLFGVDSPQDAAECEAACAAAASGVEARVISCRSGVAPNPKISKLIQLATHASRDRWIVSDSESLPDATFLDSFRGEWRDGGAAALTAGYRFAGAELWPQRLDHLPALLTLWPGVAVAEWGTRQAPGGLGFTLGACTGLLRGDLDAAGGWEAFGTYLAEDHRLGAVLAAAGRPVRLAHAILTLDADPAGNSIRDALRGWLLHQHRVTLTYRVCNPAGALGMVLTQGFAWGALLVLCNPLSVVAWGVAALVVAVRLITARGNARLLDFPMEKRRFHFDALVLLASFAETLFWLISWLPLPVRWGARTFRVQRGGKFTPS